LLPPLVQNTNISINSSIAPVKSNPSDYTKPVEGSNILKKTKSTVRKKKAKKTRRSSEIRHNPTPDAAIFYRIRVESGKRNHTSTNSKEEFYPKGSSASLISNLDSKHISILSNVKVPVQDITFRSTVTKDLNKKKKKFEWEKPKLHNFVGKPSMTQYKKIPSEVGKFQPRLSLKANRRNIMYVHRYPTHS
jgi:hypothetical protein